MFNLPCSSILDWCFGPSLHWTLWTDHEQLICVRHSISREEAEYWHVISLYQSVHILFYFWKFPNYINHISLFLPFKSTFRKILKMSNMFSEAFWTDLGLCWISVKDTMSVWFPWSMALLSITWVMSLHVFVFSTQNVVGSLVFGVLEKIKNME